MSDLEDVWFGGCLIWRMSGLEDVWFGGCLVWRMSGLEDVWFGGRIVFHHPQRLFNVAWRQVLRLRIGLDRQCSQKYQYSPCAYTPRVWRILIGGVDIRLRIRCAHFVLGVEPNSTNSRSQESLLPISKHQTVNVHCLVTVHKVVNIHSVDRKSPEMEGKPKKKDNPGRFLNCSD